MRKIPSVKNSAVLQKLFYRLTGLMLKAVNNYLDFYCVGQTRVDPRLEDGYFQTADGRRLPVFINYRYSIKPGWNYFSSLATLHTLIQKNLVTSEIRSFFKEAIGIRTLQRSLSEIEEVTRRVAVQYQDLFFPESIQPFFQPVFIPSDNEIRSRLTSCRENHRILFSKLARFGVELPTQEVPKVLEIGYISGGYSLFAFERLGFQAFGIDNFYGDNTRKSPLPHFIKERTAAAVDFRTGDITRQTDFDDEEIDIVYSASVLEHIAAPSDAFAEMSRILKPGGLMIHDYNPFFCPNGGHALGILDCPWGHVRVSDKDYLRYMDELRPFETDAAKHWTTYSLNKLSIQQLQKELVRHGFKILFWQQHAAAVSQHSELTPEIMQECFALHPHIGLADLITSTASFAARKVEFRG